MDLMENIKDFLESEELISFFEIKGYRPLAEKGWFRLLNIKNNTIERMGVFKDINNEKLDKIVEFLADKKRGTSFRKLVKGILEPSARNKEYTADAKTTIDDIVNTIKNNKENLNATDAEIQALINSLK